MAAEPDSLLVTIEPKSAFAVFTTENATAPIIAELRKHAANAPRDVSTAKGRKAIASYARRFSTAKAHLESFGAELAKDAKEIPKKIDAARRIFNATCDELRDATRAPLTAWEAAEEKRVEGHKATLAGIENAMIVARNGRLCTAAEIGLALEWLLTVDAGKGEEFADEIEAAKIAALDALEAADAAREQYEAEQAELVKLRREAAACEEADRLAAEAKAEAERKARQAELDAANAARIAEQAAQAERDRLEAAANAERAAAARREEELRAQAALAEQRAQEAVRAAQEATAKAERDAREAKEREEAATRAREADEAHRAQIIHEARVGISSAGICIPDEDAAELLEVIAAGKIRHLQINF